MDNIIVNKFREWDKSLLVNHPRLWALRLPVLVGYLVVFNLIAGFICFVFPLHTYNVTSMFDWLWLFGVVELIPLGFWLWKFSQFSPEKELERTHPAYGMLEILLYMVCIFIFLSPTLTSSAILEFRYSRMATLPEINAAENSVDYYGKDRILTPKDSLFGEMSFYFVPDTDIEQIRVVIVGSIVRNEILTDEKVGAFYDLNLEEYYSSQ